MPSSGAVEAIVILYNGEFDSGVFHRLIIEGHRRIRGEEYSEWITDRTPKRWIEVENVDDSAACLQRAKDKFIEMLRYCDPGRIETEKFSLSAEGFALTQTPMVSGIIFTHWAD